MLLHITFCVAAQIKGLNHSPYKTDIKTLSFEVLDINFEKGLVAYKHTYEILVQEDETGTVFQTPCDCGYAGMQDKPFAGVVLGTYDLNNDAHGKTFIVYESVDGHENCTKIEESQVRLAEAKKHFSEEGLDITKKPKLHKIADQKSFSVNHNNQNIQFKITSEVVEDEEDFMKMINHYKIYNEQDLMFEQKFLYSPVMAGTGHIKFISYYKHGDQILLLENFIHNSGMVGYYHNEFFSFSPIINLASD